MVKKRDRQKQKIRQSRLPLCQESDDVFDEVDKFHAYDEKLLKLVRKPAEPVAKEVLRIAADDDFSDHELLDVNSKKEEVYLPKNKWGKRRENYYGPSYNKKNFGTRAVINSDEEEILQFEEEDALARQKKLESGNAYIDFDRLVHKWDASSYEQTNLSAILQITGNLESDVDKISINTTAEGKSEISTQRNNLHDIESESDDELMCTNDTLRKRRKITYEIRKNKGIRKDNRKKGKQHSRIMKRIQYKKALIKKRSQVPDVRPEITNYDGEKRGIRVGTIKSIKF